MPNSQLYNFLGDHHSKLKLLYKIARYRYHQLKLKEFKHEVKFIKVNPSKSVSFLAGNLQLKGDLYLANSPTEVPTILLLHGSSIFGRRLPFIPAVAAEFQQLNYNVFAIDLRAHGESEKPQDYTPEAFDFAQDVTAAFDYLETEFPQNTQPFYVVGHSFGAGVATAALTREPRIAKVVLFAPPRRLRERFLNPEAQEKQKLLLRWQIDMELHRPLNYEFWHPVMAALDLETYIEALEKHGHPPIFLIDAQQEPQEDLAFFEEMYRRISDPINYWTIPNTGHYLNTGFVFKWSAYHQPTIQTFVNKIDQWFIQTEAQLLESQAVTNHSV
jgi:pimeloyl-ACP methyl ester carboxylesterase